MVYDILNWLCTVVTYIANNMNLDQTVLLSAFEIILHM